MAPALVNDQETLLLCSPALRRDRLQRRDSVSTPCIGGRSARCGSRNAQPTFAGYFPWFTQHGGNAKRNGAGDASGSQDDAMEEEGVQADVFFDSDLYDAVVAAAFGGVRVNLNKDASMLVHPLWPFLVCIPLWMTQMTALMFLRLDQDLEKTVHLHGDPGKTAWQITGNSLLTMQLMLIFVVQGVLFKELLGALRLLVFVLNPSAWTDIRRPNPDKMRSFGRCMFHTSFVAPFPIIAMLLKTGIACQVCIDSVSIILEFNKIRDVIYGSLVITFIADLDDVFWRMFSLIFRLDEFNAFILKTASHKFVRTTRAQASFKWFHNCVSCLRRVHNGRKIENFVAFSIVCGFFTYQFAVILFALDTNILPMARDVCTLWRWEIDAGDSFSIARMLYRLVTKYFLFMDMHEEMMHVSQAGAICDDKSYDRMRHTDVLRIVGDYPDTCIVGVVSLVTVFFMPQLIYAAINRISIVAEEFEEFEDYQDELKDEEEEIGLRKQLDSLRRDIDMLMQDVPSRGGSRQIASQSDDDSNRRMSRSKHQPSEP